MADRLGEDPGLDDVLVTSRWGGRVHRWDCVERPSGAYLAWTPRMAGLDDRACPRCLPEGLPS